MKILITGGCGFVGTNLVARLTQVLPDASIRVLDNESLGKRGHLEPYAGEFIHGDIRDQASIDAALDGVDCVVHLAADTRVIESIENPALNFSVNVDGTFRLIESMRAKGIKRFINASTGGAIIGTAVPPVHEGMLPQPLSPYGASKLAVEGYCSAFSGSYDFQALSLRFSNVYGPRSFHKGSVVAAFFKRILLSKPLIVYGDGSQTRDYINVSDICDGIIAGINSSYSGVLQLGSGVPLSINGLIDQIRAVVAPSAVEVVYEPSRQGEIDHTHCDITKARNTIAFSPKVALDKGLGEAWQWFLSRSGDGNRPAA